MFATYLRNFFKEGEPKISIFSSEFFFLAELFQSIGLLRTKKALGGSGGMLLRKFFENLHDIVAILELFEQFLGKFCLNFLPLNLSISPNMMHFVHTFSITRV